VYTILQGGVSKGETHIYKKKPGGRRKGLLPKHQATLQKPHCVPPDSQQQAINNVVAVCPCKGPRGGRPAAAYCSIIEHI